MATSIIQIDVQDEKFKAFTEAFEKYKASLKDMPKDWAAGGAASVKAGAEAEKSFKNTLKTSKDLNKSVSDGAHFLKSVAKTSGEIALNFASTAASIAKWVSFGGLLSGFGLGALAANSSDIRRRAQVAGVSTGDLRATNANFGKYLGDPEGTLNKITDVQNDLSKSYLISRMGGKPGENSAEMLPELIKNAVKQFKGVGGKKQQVEALGLTQIFDINDLRALSKLTEKELNETIAAFQRDRKALEVSDADSQLMQNFWIQLKRSGEQLETSFIKALAPLSPIFENLAKAVTGAIADFLNSEEVKKAMVDFTSWISSPEAKEAVKGFIHGVGEAAKFLVKLLDVIGTIVKPFTVVGETIGNVAGFLSVTSDKLRELKETGKINSTITNDGIPVEQKFKPITPLVSSTPTAASAFLKGVEAANKLPTGILDNMWEAESGRGKNMLSSAGAEGHFQFMPATAKEYGLSNPYDFKESASAAGKKLKHLIERYHGNVADALAAYNWGEGNLDKFIAGKGGRHLPKETNNHLHKFGITVNNQAGSDLVITSNGLK